MPCQLFPEWEAKRLQCKASKYMCSKFKTVEISCDPLGRICYPGRNFCPMTGVFCLTL